MDQQARRGTQECVGADSLEGHRGAHPNGLRGKEPRGAGEAGRLRHRKEGLAWTRRRPLQDLCPRTSSQERQQAGASEQTLAPGDKSPAVPIWPQSKQSTSALQPPSRPSTCGTRFTAHFPITHPGMEALCTGQSLSKTQANSSTYVVNEETLAFFSHCENKRYNRNITRLHANPLQVAEDRPLCHGPILPPMQVPSCSVTI